MMKASTKPPTSIPQVNRLGRLVLVAMGMASLLCGVWGGLLRLPLNLPLPSNNANWITFHGPLMVCGFLGTVIALERAVGLGGWWTYAAPLLTGTGALLLILGTMGQVPVTLILAGSLCFWLVTLRIVRLQRVTFTIVMSAGALAWGVGNAFWRAGWPFNRVVPWWIAFLALTILGERLDLSRFQKPSKWSQPLLYGALGLFGCGLLLTPFRQIAGERLLGLGLLALGGWLGSFDIARRTVRQRGLPRFMAACLLLGFVWLAAAGALLLVFSPLGSGLHYDAVLHSFFLGFVFSMIFGHAPVIFPAVLGLRPSFRTVFYGHVVLLHLGLLLRIGADLAKWGTGRQWGGSLAAVAIGLFLLNTILSFVMPVNSKCQAAPTVH